MYLWVRWLTFNYVFSYLCFLLFCRGLRSSMHAERFFVSQCIACETKKTSQAILPETLISYQRSTTQIDLLSTLHVHAIHSWLITGSVPGGSYSFHFRPPSKVHSELKSIRQSHHLSLSVISFKTYFSFSSVFAFDVFYSNCPHPICQELFWFFCFF